MTYYAHTWRAIIDSRLWHTHKRTQREWETHVSRIFIGDSRFNSSAKINLKKKLLCINFFFFEKCFNLLFFFSFTYIMPRVLSYIPAINFAIAKANTHVFSSFFLRFYCPLRAYVVVVASQPVPWMHSIKAHIMLHSHRGEKAAYCEREIFSDVICKSNPFSLWHIFFIFFFHFISLYIRWRQTFRRDACHTR